MDLIKSDANPTLGLKVLVIHEALPRPDRSGTDMKLMQVLRVLREQGHAVTYVGRSGVDRERYSHPLEALGIRIYAHDAARLRYAGVNDPVQWDFRDVLTSQHFDLAILYQWFWTQISIPEHYLDAIRQFSPRTRIAILSDDQNGLKEEYLAQASGLLSDRFRATDIKQRELEAYGLADLILSDSETDTEEIGVNFPDLRRGSLTVTREVPTRTKGFAQREGVLLVGDFSNRTSRDGAQWLLREIWPSVRRQLPTANLYIAGNSSTLLESAAASGIQVLGRVEDLGELYERCRVFAASTRSCTGIQTKVLSALSFGLPAVTTSTTAKRLRLAHQNGALLADNASAFANEIVRLHGDSALWDAMSIRAQEHVRREFCEAKLRAQVRDLAELVPQIQPREFDPNHVFSVRRVEKEFPEVITHPDPQARLILRSLGYLRLGEELLARGKPAEARQQFLHVFPYIGSQIPPDDCFARLLLNLARCDEAFVRCGGDYLAEARGCLEKQHSGLPAGRGAAMASTKTPPDISVILPTFNRSAVLASCLGALQKQSLGRDRYEVIVVDDGSTDDTAPLCRDLSPGYKLRYYRQSNGGAGVARRLGLTKARGRYVLLINDDTIASPTLLEEHLRAQHSCPARKFAVLGDFLYPSAANRRALTHFVSVSPFLFPMVTMQKGFYQGMAYFITCNLSVAREDALAAGSFDSRFRVAEDTDLGARLTARGLAVLYWPAAKATHDHLNLRIDDVVRRARSYGPATLLLAKKYPALLGDGTGPLGTLDEPWLRKTREFLRNSRNSVEDALAATRRLDDYDFAPLLRAPNSATESLADSIIDLLDKAIPQIHWFYLLEGVVQALAQTETTPGGQESWATNLCDKDASPCRL